MLASKAGSLNGSNLCKTGNSWLGSASWNKISTSQLSTREPRIKPIRGCGGTFYRKEF
jgi:hypothetical protein